MGCDNVSQELSICFVNSKKGLARIGKKKKKRRKETREARLIRTKRRSDDPKSDVRHPHTLLTTPLLHLHFTTPSPQNTKKKKKKKKKKKNFFVCTPLKV